MGISNKSNGRKSDKETQSPMLKIFKDIMQKDTIQQEKVTLLKDKKRDKRKKLYSESRSKSDPRSYDSSSTERYKTNKQANITVQDILKDKQDYGLDRSGSDAVRGGIRESWWFWKDLKKKEETNKEAKKEEKRTDDTCSCVSCALKKIISSECTCVTLLVLLFSVSVVCAFLLIFNGDTSTDFQRQLIKRQLPEGYGTERLDRLERVKWDNQLNSLDSVSNILDNSGNNYKTSYLSDMNAELSGNLASILDSQKIDSHTSEKLRDFFQKLIQTDVKIKKLKQDINHYYQDDNINSFTERFKRSLKNRFNNHHFRAFDEKKTKNYKRYSIKDKKRSLGNRYNITRYVIEEEKLLVQYEPGRKRNFPKCAHSHETKSHEKKLKHPFYKHSQRIDEMLKYKKPEMVTYNLIQNENKQKTVKPKINKMNLFDYKVYDERQDIHTDNIKKVTKLKTNKDTETSFDLETFLSTTPLYDVALSVSTFINPWEAKSNSKPPRMPTHDRIGYRKLMEANEEDEGLNYYLKEVLNDDQQRRDHMDRPVAIMKRDSDVQLPNHYKYPSSQILNPNWKGPMPFYPDEINAMIKHAAIQNFHIQSPVTTKNMKNDRDKIKKDVSDTEYIEDYADNKFNKMVKMAQAYSDYGVVYNKKDEESKDKINNPENRFKQSLDKNFFKTDLFIKSSNDPSEGIRFEYKKGNVKNEHEELIKDITKHIKFVKHPPMHEGHTTTLRPINADYENILSNKGFRLPMKSIQITKSAKSNKNLFCNLRKISRSLKSIVVIDEIHETANISSELNQTNINNTTTNLDSVFSFLALMGDWFRTLSNLSGESSMLIGNSTANNITQINSTKSNKKRLKSNSSDVLYPSYDFDMVDNIGHRSRVLMSVGENNTDEKSHTKHERHIDVESSNQSDSDNVVHIALILAANTQNISKANNTNNIKNITNIVKRSVDDNKLVFWNDLYDDNEYGIKLDYADKIREKHLVNSSGVMQNSKKWLQDKLKNITGKVKNKLKPIYDKKTYGCKKNKVKTKEDSLKPKKRIIRNSNENPAISMKKSFAALNANMKRVCQQAAKAVQNTRNIEVRDDNKEGAAATSLMQQLVRLMSDLVEIQVLQKTCAKLPSDLQQFLEWLTAPAENSLSVHDLTPGYPDYVAVDDGFAQFEKSTKADFLTTLSEDSHQDDRTDCLGTIKAVQDLILQYEGMNDDDKSKMSGVKEYLENQLNFLNKKVTSNINSFKLFKKRELPRVKRNSQVKPKKYIKNFSKKHTRTTFNHYTTENHEDVITLIKNFANNNNNNGVGVKVLNSKLTKDKVRRP